MSNDTGSPIDRVEVLALGPDLPRHAYTAHLPAPYTTSTLVKITDADGAQGLGQFDSDSYGAFDLAPLETLRTLAPRLIGRDPLDRTATWDELRDHGTAPDMPGVRSALDIAQWDLVARRADAPLHELIAPRRAGVTPRTAAAHTPRSPRSRARPHMPTTCSDTWPRVTRPSRSTPGATRSATSRRSARRAMSPATTWRSSTTRKAASIVATAERMMPALGDLGVRWFEAPLPDLDLEGYRRLMRLGDVAIVPAGDAIWDERLMTDILRDPPWSAMRFDVTFAGGITSAIRLFDVAAAYDLPVELTSYGQTLVQSANLHVMLAFGRTSFFERAVPSEEFEFGVTTPITMDAAGTVGRARRRRGSASSWTTTRSRPPCSRASASSASG